MRWNEGNENNRSKKAWKFLATVSLSAVMGGATALAAQPFVQRGGFAERVASVMAPADGAMGNSPGGAIKSTTSSSTGQVKTMGTSGYSLSDVVAGPSETPPAETTTMVSVNVHDGIISAVKRVEPAVMGVVNYSSVADFFTQQTKLEATGIGTGVLFHKNHRYGYVVTNNHVVEGATRVQVVLGSGHHVQATVLGTDPYTDLAVLRVPASEIASVKPAVFANSDKIQVGEPAIAIGTPMGLDFADTVTAGIVSAKKRIMPVEEPQTETVLDYQAVIQTDAAINPGNSGGPLCDINGNVIGINSSKIVAQSFEGMGFAIPANEVVNIADQLMNNGHALHPSLGISGYSLASLPDQMWPSVPVDYGVWVQSISSNTTKAAGLEPQDVIVNIDGHVVQTMADLRTYLFQEKPGKMVTLKVYRDQQERTIRVILGTMETQNSTNMQGSASPGMMGGFGGSGSGSSSEESGGGPFSAFPFW